jgi:hypothetical protein
MLSKKQLEDYCLPYSGHLRCRFLAEDEQDWAKCFCLKKTKRRVDIDSETDDYVKELHKKGITPESQGVPIGDNCEGFIFLRHLEQGFDKP